MPSRTCSTPALSGNSCRATVRLVAPDGQLLATGVAATADGGTSADVFAGWDPHYRAMLYGKTGTAERQPNPDQSWYACYVADPLKPIVVVTTIERGGFGAETAAPAARLILNEWFDLRDDEFHEGSDQSN